MGTPNTDISASNAPVNGEQTQTFSSCNSPKGPERDFREARQIQDTAVTEAQKREQARAVDPEQERKAQEEAEKLQKKQLEEQQARREAMQKELREAAQATAAADHEKSPNANPDKARAQQEIERITKKYADVITPEMQQSIADTYRNSYQAERDAKWNDLSWYKKAYYGAQSLFKSCLEGLESVVAGAVKVVKAAGTVVSTVAKAAVNVTAALTSADTWTAIGSGIASAATWTWDKLTSADTWKAVGNGLLAAGKAVVGFSVTCLTDPVKALQMTWTGVKAVGGFLKDMSDSMGLTQLGAGLWKAATMPFTVAYDLAATGVKFGLNLGKYATGQMSFDDLKEATSKDIRKAIKNCADGIRAAGSAIVGAVKVIGELTGVTDVIMCVKYAAEGNMTMAAMHAGFALASFGSLAATVATGGAAFGSMAAVAAGRTTLKAAAKQVLKVAAKEFLEHAGKEIGEQVVKQAGAKLGKEALEKAAREAATIGVEKLGKEVLAQGEKALTREAMQTTMRESTEKVVGKLLKEAGVAEKVEKLTFDLLKKTNGTSTRKLARELEEMGIKDAKEAAKQIKKLVKSGKADAEIKQLLEDSISKPIKEHVERGMEKQFKETLEASLRGQVKSREAQALAEAVEKQAKELAEKSGKSLKECQEKLVKEYTEAGWKGAKEGIEKATRAAVREGIEKAFKRFRSQRTTSRDNDTAVDFTPHETESAVLVQKSLPVSEVRLAGMREQGRASMMEAVSSHRAPTASRMQEVDGRTYRLTFRIEEDGKERLIGKDLVAEEAPKEAKKKTTV